MNPNYIQLEIGGKKRGFKFGLGFLERLVDELDTPLEEISQQMKNNPFKVIPQLVRLSHIYNEMRAKREIDLDVFEVIDWIDDEGGIASPNMVKFLDAWNNSMMHGQPQEEEPKDKKVTPAVKKNRPKTTSPLIGSKTL